MRPPLRDKLLLIVAVFLPPLAVGVRLGPGSLQFVVNVVLTLLLWFPGVLHAWFLLITFRGVDLPQIATIEQSEPAGCISQDP